MQFIKKNLSTDMIEDNVFKVVNLAKIAKQRNPEGVVDATIGSLFDEEGRLVALNTVFDVYNQLPNTDKAAYAQGFAGNKDYLEWINKEIVGNAHFSLPHQAIATVGGSGAISLALSTTLEAKDSVIAPNIAWGSYKLMAENLNLGYETYNLLDENHFDLTSFKETCLRVAEKQDKLFIIINDPCHNPTGLSMGKKVWEEVVAFLNSLSKDKSIIILNDVAYIEYSYDLTHSKEYIEAINKLDDNSLFLIAYSLSKSFTFYGMRTGALFVAHQDSNKVQLFMNVLEKGCRSIWSNIPNASMKAYSEVMSNHRDAYMEEKQVYIDLLRERSEIFLKEAKEVGLACYRYDEGFFVTLKLSNQERDVLHAKLMEHDIFTVSVNLGIRIAICSLPKEKAKGLARRIKEIQESIE